MNTLMYNLFDWERPDSFGVQAFLRIFEAFVAGYCILYAWEWGFYILRIGDVVLPLGLANYIDISIFFGNHLALWNAGLLTASAAAAFFLPRMKPLYLLVFLLLHLQYVARFSLGEIPHSSNLIGFSVLGLGLGFTFMRSRTQALSFAYGLLIFFLGLGYTTAGISKLVATGVGWVDGYHLWLWIAEKGTDVLSAEGAFHLSFIQQMALESRTVATLILSVGLLTELTAFLIWWKKLRPWITLMVIGMHIGIYYSMNIFFMSYMLELVLVGFPWHILMNRMHERGYFSRFTASPVPDTR